LLTISEIADRALVGRVATVMCAIPVVHVVETLRPLPVEPVGTGPGFIRGVSIIRGIPTVVIDTAAVLGTTASTPTRFVVVRVGERRVALTFDEVLDVRRVEKTAFADLPPLVRAVTADAVAAITTADAELLVLLETSRVIPADTWAKLDAEVGRP
jgi:purine-binding chemotaxis protein CheW